MEIKHILGFVSVVLFFIYFLLSKNPGKSYVLFLLIFLPFIDLNLTPEEYGSFSVFDFLSFFILFFSIKDFFNFSIKNNSYFFLFLLLTILLFIGSITSDFIGNSLYNFLKHFSIFIYAKILIDECLKDRGFINLVVKYLKLGCIISLTFLCIQLVIGTKFTFYPDLNPNIFLDTSLRYPGYFQDPQKYGQYLSMVSFLFLMKTEKKSGYQKLNFIIFIIILLAMLLTGARAAFLGLFVGILLFSFSLDKKVWLSVIFFGLIGYFFIQNFSEHFSLLNRADDFTSSLDTRNSIWNEGLDIFFAHPLFGIGIGNHHNYITQYTTSGYYIIDNEVVFYGTESGYLQILIEYGLFGFVIFLLLVLIPIITALRSYKKIHDFNISLLIAPIISLMIAYITVNGLSDKRILLVFTTLLSLLIFLKKSTKDFYV